MKSITKKISLLLVLSAVLMLSSCLDSGKGSWAGNEEYSYITRDEVTNTVYARTIAGYFITSEKIKTLTPGSIAFISYQINFDEAEQTLIGDNIIVYHVALAGEPVITDQTTIKFMDAPNTPINHFENILNPTFSSNEYFGDRWFFPYTVKMKKGETLTANFYKGTDQTLPPATNDEVVIDIRLTKTGVAEAGATDKIVADYVVVNFSELRSELKMMFSDKNEVNLKFRFYRTANGDELYTTKENFPMQLK